MQWAEQPPLQPLPFLSPQTVLYSAEVLRLPYSVTVFEDRMYWVDWSEIALFSADKFNGENIEHVSAGHLVSAGREEPPSPLTTNNQ